MNKKRKRRYKPSFLNNPSKTSFKKRKIHFEKKAKKTFSYFKIAYTQKRIKFLKNKKLKNFFYTMKNVSEALLKIYRKVLRILLATFSALLIILSIGLFFATATYAVFAKDISDPDRLINRNNTGTILYAKNGEVLYQTFGSKYRKLIGLDEIPDNIEKATIASEDQDFYNHNGVSTRGIIRAIIKNFKAGELKEGGSSITQQLVKNALLNPEKSFYRKYQEIVLALELERRYEKEDIFKMYFNEIYFGEGAWGIQEAAKVYFEKEAKDLTLAESSLLAGLPAAPSKYSPIENPEASKGRQNYVLSRMLELGMITEKEKGNAFQEKLVFKGQKAEIKAPHFVMTVMEQLNNDYGEDLVEKGGLRVYTSLDMGKQVAAEKALEKEMPRLRMRGASNSALVSSDPRTGEVLAYVGSSSWENDAWGKVNIPFTHQQPGSSFKPFAYMTALEKGWMTTTKIEDKTTNFGGDPPYVPKNYDGKLHGNVTLRKALANSYNIPAVKALSHAGLDTTIENASKMGLTTLDKEKYNYGLSLVLGGGDVYLSDMVNAYGTLANQGVYVKPKYVNKVVDRFGDDITKKEITEKRVVDSAYPFLITNILSDNDARTDTFGPNSPLKLNRPAAAKTGTTNDYKDGWTLGYTPNLVAGVWVGNNNNESMGELPGALGAGYIWNTYMDEALNNMPVEDFQKPDNVVEKWIWTDGRIASAGTSGAKKEYFVSGTEPKGQEFSPPKSAPKEEKPKEVPKKEEVATPPPETPKEKPVEPPKKEKPIAEPPKPTDPPINSPPTSGGNKTNRIIIQ